MRKVGRTPRSPAARWCRVPVGNGCVRRRTIPIERTEAAVGSGDAGSAGLRPCHRLAHGTPSQPHVCARERACRPLFVQPMVSRWSSPFVSEMRANARSISQHAPFSSLYPVKTVRSSSAAIPIRQRSASSTSSFDRATVRRRQQGSAQTHRPPALIVRPRLLSSRPTWRGLPAIPGPDATSRRFLPSMMDPCPA
jgi:hypothetical protein